jgi:hypothetical protein
MSSNYVVPGAKYRHSKSGHLYVVLFLGLIEATKEPAVIYRLAPGEDPLLDDTTVWIRPVVNWLEEVTLDGQKQPRFQLVL